MKNAIVIVLLFIFTFNLGGTYIIRRIQQYQLRREIVQQIKSGIPDKELTQIIVNPETKGLLSWENEEEFIYQGMMYDVVHVKMLEKGAKLYYCITDKQETKLIDDYNKELKKKRKNKNNRPSTTKIAKFLPKINPLPQIEELLLSKEKKEANFAYLNNYSPLTLEISSPPPKEVL